MARGLTTPRHQRGPWLTAAVEPKGYMDAVGLVEPVMPCLARQVLS